MTAWAIFKRTLAGVGVAMLMSGGATAEPAAVLSNGGNPCGDFVAAQWQEQQLYETWALGYISGQNSMDTAAMRSVGAGWTIDSVMVWLRNYCSQHPLAPFANAAEQLRQELAAQEGRLPK